MEKIVPGTAGGQHIAGAPLTTNNTNAVAVGLLKNAVDERIVRIRPMSTPIDQLSRCAGARSCDAMTVEYFSVDTKATETEVALDLTGDAIGDYGDDTVITLKAKAPIFEISETVLFPSLTHANGKPITGYVTDAQKDGTFTVLVTSGDAEDLLTATKGCKIVRMGRAAAELDVQTA